MTPSELRNAAARPLAEIRRGIQKVLSANNARGKIVEFSFNFTIQSLKLHESHLKYKLMRFVLVFIEIGALNRLKLAASLVQQYRSWPCELVQSARRRFGPQSRIPIMGGGVFAILCRSGLMRPRNAFEAKFQHDHARLGTQIVL